jgi:hypothetical protein
MRADEMAIFLPQKDGLAALFSSANLVDVCTESDGGANSGIVCTWAVSLALASPQSAGANSIGAHLNCRLALCAADLLPC